MREVRTPGADHSSGAGYDEAGEYAGARRQQRALQRVAATASVGGARVRLEIAPFSEQHLDGATELLAARHRADRARAPELPVPFEDAAAARPLVEAELRAWGTSGVVALRGGRTVGYLLGSLVLPAPTAGEALTMRPRSVRSGYAGHAVDPAEDGEVYRALYAAAAPRWLTAGCFAHYVLVPAADRQALDAWFSLGFGQQMARAVRDTGPVAGRAAAAGIEIHRGGPEDIEVVMRLVERLSRYHAEPPIFLPYLPETAAGQRAHHEELLAGPANVYWLAYRGGHAAGMQVFVPPQPAMVTPERSIHLHEAYTEAAERGGGVAGALLDHAMAWARQAGYERCTVSWMTTNLLATRFWLRSGFRPLSYRLARFVDERIACANGMRDAE